MSDETKAPNMRQCNKCAAYFDQDTIPGAVHLASCRIYNGHKNYETWAVSLWLDNDQGSYNHWREAAVECRGEVLADRNPFMVGLSLTLEDRTRYRLAERLKSEIREQCEEGIEGMAADLLGAAFDEVDWSSIAEGFMEDMPELPAGTTEEEDEE